jgi:hypothetical protein
MAGALSEFHLIRHFQLRPRLPPFPAFLELGLGFLEGSNAIRTLRVPLPTKEGGTLRTVADAANYILALPEERRRTHWDRTVQLLLDMADLFYDRQLNLKKRSLSLDELQTAHARIYKGMDANKDGRLTMEEMRAFLRGASRSLRPGSPRE